MPTDTAPSPGGLRPPKPTTRNSIRQSLNISSMGKALADVMNKSEPRGPAKKGKDVGSTPNSRRTSTTGFPQSGALTASGRSSIGEARSTLSRRENTRDPQTITRSKRRTSASLQPGPASVDESSTCVPESTSPLKASRITRSSSLRPRSSQTTALPKYRPKTNAMDPPSHPVTSPRVGHRRKLSTSTDEEKEDKGLFCSGASAMLQSASKKISRPISPLPHRSSALKVNLTSAINITPDRKTKMLSPKKNTSLSKTSARLLKAAKTSPTASVRQPAAARPSSSSSTRTTPPTTPLTPKVASGLRNALGLGRSGNAKGNSPLCGSVRSSPTPESPLAKRSRAGSTNRTPMPSSTPYLPVGNSEDSFDVDDVEMLLAPTASLAAPTPALPRLKPSRPRRQDQPGTLSRRHSSGQLPAHSHLTYLSPLPPTAEESPSVRQTGNEKSSLMSWDQLAKQSSMTMTEEEAESMITGLDLPFKSRSVSPDTPLMHLDVVLESPNLSALPSPGGYASISHVLLPDVTPSPAAYSEDRYDNAPEIPAVDAAIVTLLRLQLASAESTAKERLYQLQSLEEQLHMSKESRLEETDELAKHISYLEQQLHGTVETREKANEERTAYIASLEDQLKHAVAFRDHAVEAAVAKAEEQGRASRRATLQAEQRKWEISSAAHNVATEWKTIHTLAEDELDSIKTDRHTLVVLLAGLDQCQREIYRGSA